MRHHLDDFRVVLDPNAGVRSIVLKREDQRNKLSSELSLVIRMLAGNGQAIQSRQRRSEGFQASQESGAKLRELEYRASEGPKTFQRSRRVGRTIY